MLDLLFALQAVMPGSAVAARVDALLPRVPLPREGQVAVFATASADTIYAGDQLEILTTAWFPVAVRQRLRRPPMLRPPSLSGVYSLPVITLPGVAALRTIGETSYELFASHQLVFPFAPGPLTVPAAELAFSMPGTRGFFGEDRLDERRSPERTIVVRPLPAGGRPAHFNGAVARELSVSWRLGAPNMRVGELLAVDLRIAGQGNLNLWPVPAVEWPAGLRVYPDRVTEVPEWRGGRLGGERRARFLLLADSTGSITLPAVRVAHFNPGTARYHEAFTAPVVIPVLPPRVAATPRAAPLWVVERPPPIAVRVVERWGTLVLILGALVPVAAGAADWLRARRRRRPTPVVAGADARFERLLETLADDPSAAAATGLAAALRRAGISRADADTAVALHEQLRRRRFAPDRISSEGDDDFVQAAARWLRRVPSRIGRRVGGGVVLFWLGAPGGAVAQAPDPAALYREAAWEAAVAAQREVVRATPRAATAWRNYATALWMARRDGAAAAALLEAYRLEPRNGGVRRLWGELALTYRQLRPLAPVVPLTPQELLLGGAAIWVVAAVGWVAGRRRLALAAGGLALLLATAGVGIDRARRQPAALTAEVTPLRLSPHGLAPLLGTVDGLALVPVEAEVSGWIRVRDPLGRRGWVREASVVRLRRLD